MVPEDPSGLLDEGSAFRNWTSRCKGMYTVDDCLYKVCNLTKEPIPLSRAVSGLFPSLPTIEDLTNALRATVYDDAPYSPKSSVNSFRSCLEGFASSRGLARDVPDLVLHGQVRDIYYV
jgi:hypothetical protein